VKLPFEKTPYILAAALWAYLSFAANGALADSLQDQPYLTGDWGGLRTWLADRGIAPFASYSTGVWANVHGGFATGVRYEGFADWGFDLNLERLVGWQGGSFHIDWHSNVSGLPSQELVGQFPTNDVLGLESANAVRFYEIYLEQRLWDDALLIKAGQLAVDDDFFVSRYASPLLNGSFAFFGSGRAQQIAPFYPVAAPGIYVSARQWEQWELRAGAYTAAPGADTSSNYGFDWSLDNGVSVGTEVATSRRPAGLPGRYTLGVLGTTKQLTSFANGHSVHGTLGLYVMIDQALALDSDGKPKVGAFLRVGYDPLLDRSVLRVYGNTGFTLFGPLPGRDHDSLSVGFSYTNFAPDYVRDQHLARMDVTSHESIAEFTYQAAVTGWLIVQPDLQFVFDPHYSHHDAIVLGLQLTINF
jgi:porin